MFGFCGDVARITRLSSASSDFAERRGFVHRDARQQLLDEPVLVGDAGARFVLRGS